MVLFLFRLNFFFIFILLFIFKIVYMGFFYEHFDDEFFFDIYYENESFHSDLNNNGLFVMWSTDLLIWLIRFFIFGF